MRPTSDTCAGPQQIVQHATAAYEPHAVCVPTAAGCSSSSSAGWVGFQLSPLPRAAPDMPVYAVLCCCRIETVSWRPRAYVYHNFLTQEEANHVVKMVENKV
jgi:hypothetical protein